METVWLNHKLRGNEKAPRRENAAKTSLGCHKRGKGVIWFPKTWNEFLGWGLPELLGLLGQGVLGLRGEEGEGVGRDVPDSRDTHGLGDEGVCELGDRVVRDGGEQALGLVEVTIFTKEFRSRQTVHA